MQTVEVERNVSAEALLHCDVMESSTNRWHKEGIWLGSTMFSSSEHMNVFAMSGPRGEAIATPSTSSYNLQSILKS